MVSNVFIFSGSTKETIYPSESYPEKLRVVREKTTTFMRMFDKICAQLNDISLSMPTSTVKKALTSTGI